MSDMRPDCGSERGNVLSDEAFGRLVIEFGKRKASAIRNVARKYRIDEGDLWSATTERMMRDKDKFMPGEFGGWGYQILVWTAQRLADEYRRRYAREPFIEDFGNEDGETDHLTMLAAPQREEGIDEAALTCISAAMHRLSDRARFIVMEIANGKSRHHVAQRLGITKQDVTSIEQAAYAEIRRVCPCAD